MTVEEDCGLRRIPETPQEMDAEKITAYVVSVQSLLSQLSNLSVRADILNGRLGVGIDQRYLEQLDELRCLVCPWWTGGRLGNPDSRHSEAAQHIIDIYSGSDSLMRLPGDEDDSKTFKQWKEALEKIATSPYWYIVKAADRCVHTEDNTSAEHREVKSEAISQPSRDRKGRKVSKPSSRRVEEVILLSSDDSSDSEQNSTSSELNSDIDSSPLRKRVRNRAMTTKREVVTPPIFSMDGKNNLGEFLNSFERYFDNKYIGNEYDKTQQLGSFLEGKLLEVYEIMGGRKIKYFTMRKHLEMWYKKQGIGGKKYWREQFAQVIPGPDEPIDIYGLRVKELAELAYPRSTREAARQLRCKFLDTINPVIAEKVIETERMLNARSKKKDKMTFQELVDLATKIRKDKTTKKHTVVVNWANDDVAPPFDKGTHDRDLSVQERRLNAPVNGTTYRESQPETGERGGSFGHRYSTSPRSHRDKVCHHCRRRGHIKRDCWRAQNACLICGRGHRLVDCPRYLPRDTKKDMSNGTGSSSALN